MMGEVVRLGERGLKDRGKLEGGTDSKSGRLWRFRRWIRVFPP